MSQAGIVDIEGTHPQIPTLFVCNVGSAIPIVNTLEILGSAVAATSVPLETVGSGNTVSIQVQHASASASSVANKAGVASFDSSQFVVDANGYVSFSSSGSVESVNGTAHQISVVPTSGNVVVALTDGISIGSYQPTAPPTGGIICPGAISTGANDPGVAQLLVTTVNGLGCESTGVKVNDLTDGVQYGFLSTDTFSPNEDADTVASFAATPSFAAPDGNGIDNACCFLADSDFTSNAGEIFGYFGFLHVPGSSASGSVFFAYGSFIEAPTAGELNIASYADNLVIGQDASITAPPANGALIEGNIINQALNAYEVVATDANKTLTSINNSTPTYVLTSNGPSSQPTFQSLPGFGDTITGNTGGALSPTAGNWNIVGTGSITTSGSVSTLTVQLTGLQTHNVLVGGAGTATITNIAPPATSGVPLISQGSSSYPAFGTAAIAGGGTNATSFTQTNGIVVYNGTSLVNYAGPQISSAGIMTNTAQPAFCQILVANATNVTGDNTLWTFGTTGGGTITSQFDRGGNITNPSGNVTFTAPVTGIYYFNGSLNLQNIPIGCIFAQMNLLNANTGAIATLYLAPTLQAVYASPAINGSALMNLTAGDAVTLRLTVGSAGAKTVSVAGNGSFTSYFAGFLVG